MEIAWTEAAIADMAALDKGTARRVKNAVERFAATGAGNVKKLHGIDRPSTASAAATGASAFTPTDRLPPSYVFATGKRRTDEWLLLPRDSNPRLHVGGTV